MFGVSRITAIRSLNELAKAGLVVREHGRGTRLRFTEGGTLRQGEGNVAAFRSTFVEPELQPFIHGQENRPFPQLTVDRFEYLAAEENVARALRLGPNDQVQHVVRTIYFEGKPFNCLATFVPASLGHEWSKADLEKKALLFLIKRAGVSIGRVEENITAVVASSSLAEKLQVAAGAPLLKIVRTCYEETGRPIEHLISHCVPERYSYDVAFSRQPGGDDCRISSGPISRPAAEPRRGRKAKSKE
jgi:GntR family transcriptional regulator